VVCGDIYRVIVVDKLLVTHPTPSDAVRSIAANRTSITPTSSTLLSALFRFEARKKFFLSTGSFDERKCVFEEHLFVLNHVFVCGD
jgi:hypothetical protein